MVKYALKCETCFYEFEGWFSSSEDFEKQSASHLLECPRCDSASVKKQIMAPMVRDSKTGSVVPDEMRQKAEAMFTAMRKHVAETHDYVGDKFADTARQMHYGETETKPVWGEATVEEAKALAEEGVPAVPMPKEIVPEKPTDTKKLN